MAVPGTKEISGWLGRERREVREGQLPLHSCWIRTWLLVTEWSRCLRVSSLMTQLLWQEKQLHCPLGDLGWDYGCCIWFPSLTRASLLMCPNPPFHEVLTLAGGTCFELPRVSEKSTRARTHWFLSSYFWSHVTSLHCSFTTPKLLVIGGGTLAD